MEFIKRTKDTTTRVRVSVDRAVLELTTDHQDQANAHLLSMIGGDSEIGAVWAAVSEGASFQLQLRDRASFSVSIGLEAQCFRGSLVVAGRNRPVRHLVAVSADLARTKPGADSDGKRTILCNDEPMFVLYRLAYRYGLPVVPQWAPWFMGELKQRKTIRHLVGLGCSPILVTGNKPAFLKWIGKGLQEGSIHVPQQNGPVSWTVPGTFATAMG